MFQLKTNTKKELMMKKSQNKKIEPSYVTKDEFNDFKKETRTELRTLKETVVTKDEFNVFKDNTNQRFDQLETLIKDALHRIIDKGPNCGNKFPHIKNIRFVRKDYIFYTLIDCYDLPLIDLIFEFIREKESDKKPIMIIICDEHYDKILAYIQQIEDMPNEPVIKVMAKDKAVVVNR